MTAFQDKQQKWTHRLCQVCHETWTTRVSLTTQMYVCTRCKRDKRTPKLFSTREQNSDDKQEHPQQQEANQEEWMLLCRFNQRFDTAQQQGDNSYEPHPLRMIICGTAGTRKSFLITGIAQTLGTSCLLTGTTGLAGFNICGATLHSTLQLLLQSHNLLDLQGPSLARLQ